jgi:hypothetical protein
MEKRVMSRKTKTQKRKPVSKKGEKPVDTLLWKLYT